MNKLGLAGKWIVVGVVIVIAVVLIAVYGNGGNNSAAPAAPTNSSTSAIVSDNGSMQGGNATTGNTSVTGGKVGGAGTATIPSRSSGIALLTPVPGDTWVIDTQNPIAWNKAANVPTGEIELLNASTKSLVGVILNNIAPHQTSYTWNTRDLLQSLTSPNKFTVTPGQYVIRIIFNGNNLPAITSQPFTLTGTVQ